MPPVRKRRRRRPALPGATTRAGLGWSHQQARAQLLAEFRDGDPCPFAAIGQCKYPGGRMRSWQQLDVDDWPPRAIAAGRPLVKRLAHASCNRAAGARLLNAMKSAGVRRKRSTRVSRW